MYDFMIILAYISAIVALGYVLRTLLQPKAYIVDIKKITKLLNEKIERNDK